jgi:hypothetical protein
MGFWKVRRRFLRELIAVDLHIDSGDGFPHVVPDGPFWFIDERDNFEQRVCYLLKPIWPDSQYGRRGSVGFVSETIPRVELEAELMGRLTRGRGSWRRMLPRSG